MFGQRVGDVSVQKTLQKFVGDKTLMVADRCSPYRSTLALHMWRILDGERKSNGNDQALGPREPSGKAREGPQADARARRREAR